MLLNETHDPSLTSWVESANVPDSDFPIQNLPFAIFRKQGSNQVWRGGVAIGDQIVDLAALHALAPFNGLAAEALAAASQASLNSFMGMGKTAWSALRLALSRALRTDSSLKSLVQPCLIPHSAAEFNLPCHIGDYTDFYASVHHATSVGSLFRPDNPLLPNYKWVPIAYHGRASSIEVSGQSFRRPCGQLKAPDAESPSLEACKRLDYELEVGIFIGNGNPLGDNIAMEEAEDHVFGLCLLNDWSARDIQAWEYQPLGPFLAKNFASTISPWLVTMEALAPFRTAFNRPAEDPQPLPYLSSSVNSQSGAIDMALEVYLLTEKMASDKLPPQRLSQSNFADSYWTIAQMVTHHTISGCNLRPGDLFGSGTMSGPTPKQAGSLLELSNGGKQAITLINGEQRSFLEDGDTVILKAHCDREGARKIGFGEVKATILPARNI